jgi:hypothetical protein
MPAPLFDHNLCLALAALKLQTLLLARAGGTTWCGATIIELHYRV